MVNFLIAVSVIAAGIIALTLFVSAGPPRRDSDLDYLITINKIRKQKQRELKLIKQQQEDMKW